MPVTMLWRTAPERRPLLDVELEERRRHLLVAAQRAAADTAHLLAAEGDDEAAAALLDRLDRGDDAQRPVELPSLAERCRDASRPAHVVAAAGTAEQVAVSVDVDRQPGLAQPASRQLVRSVLLSARMRSIRAPGPPPIAYSSASRSRVR